MTRTSKSRYNDLHDPERCASGHLLASPNDPAMTYRGNLPPGQPQSNDRAKDGPQGPYYAMYGGATFDHAQGAAAMPQQHFAQQSVNMSGQFTGPNAYDGAYQTPQTFSNAYPSESFVQPHQLYHPGPMRDELMADAPPPPNPPTDFSQPAQPSFMPPAPAQPLAPAKVSPTKTATPKAERANQPAKRPSPRKPLPSPRGAHSASPRPPQGSPTPKPWKTAPSPRVSKGTPLPQGSPTKPSITAPSPRVSKGTPLPQGSPIKPSITAPSPRVSKGLSSLTTTKSPVMPSKPSTSIDSIPLLIGVAEECIEKARAAAPKIASMPLSSSIQEYHALIGTSLGCMEMVLQSPKLSPRQEARLRLRYAAVLSEETENWTQAETTLAKGIALCDKVRFSPFR